MAVSLTVTPEGIHIFRVRGKLLAGTVNDLQTVLDAVGDNAYAVVNLKGAHMADSVAVGYLVRRHGLMWRGGGALALCCLHPSVTKLLAMADLNRYFTVYDHEENAVAALKTSRAVPVAAPKKRGRKPKEKKAE